jgi:3'-phosphoadenosine 5'-phosphosulfate (PAPS) 3'-phosphatase
MKLFAWQKQTINRRIIASPAVTNFSFPDHLAHEVAIALRAGQEAGALALSLQANLSTTTKGDGSPVTNGDLAADAVVRHYLQSHFPSDAILSEEQSDTAERLSSARLWIIDPIDGTRDYVTGSPEWAVQIALAINGQLVLGILTLPGENISLIGIPGHGAWISDAHGQRPLRIKNELHKDKSPVLITSKSKRNSLAVAPVLQALPEFSALHVTSVGVKVWRMISGHASLYVHPRPLAEWDVAAPAAVLIGAGGTATDLSGQGLIFNSPTGCCPGLVYSLRDDHHQLITRMRNAGVALMS